MTKKSDLSDFYRNLLGKNVAFGADERAKGEKAVLNGETKAPRDTSPTAPPSNVTASVPVTRVNDANEDPGGEHERSVGDQASSEQVVQAPAELEATVSGEEEAAASAEQEEPKAASDPKSKDQEPSRIPAGPPVQQRPSQEAVVSARERYLARKKQRES